MEEQVYILHENDEWTAPLARQLDYHKIPYSLWHLDVGHLDLGTEPPPGVYFSRMSASSHTRDHRYAPELTAQVLGWLEAHNRVVLNGSGALRLELSKVLQHLSLNREAIKTPRTHAAVGKPQILEAAESFEGQPFIVKHNRAGKGLGVGLFRSLDALRDHLESIAYVPPVDGILLVQEYIVSPESYITRCEFVGGEFMYAVRVDTRDGFELCPADSCQVGDLYCPAGEAASLPSKFEILEDFSDPILSRYEKFLANNGIHVAGIEFIRDAHGAIYTYDVNTNTNYNREAEARSGQNGMDRVARYLGAQLAQACRTTTA